MFKNVIRSIPMVISKLWLGIFVVKGTAIKGKKKKITILYPDRTTIGMIRQERRKRGRR